MVPCMLLHSWLPGSCWAKDSQQLSILWKQVANLMREIWQDWSIFTIPNLQSRLNLRWEQKVRTEDERGMFHWCPHKRPARPDAWFTFLDYPITVTVALLPCDPTCTELNVQRVPTYTRDLSAVAESVTSNVSQLSNPCAWVIYPALLSSSNI